MQKIDSFAMQSIKMQSIKEKASSFRLSGKDGLLFLFIEKILRQVWSAAVQSGFLVFARRMGHKTKP